MGCHFLLQCMKVRSESEVAQLCPTLIDPMDCSPPGSSVLGIFQARVLEWGAIAFSEQRCGLDLRSIWKFIWGYGKRGLPRWHRWQRTHLPTQQTQEMGIRSLGQEDPLEKEMTTHSSILAWRIPGTEQPGGLQSAGSQRVRHD